MIKWLLYKLSLFTSFKRNRTFIQGISFMLLIAFISTFNNIYAQNTKEIKRLFEESNEHFLYEAYGLALPGFLKLIDRGLDNANVNYKIGFCYLNFRGQVKKSVPHFKKALLDIASNYNEVSYKEKKAPKEAWFYIGKAYRILGDFDKAIDAYKQYKDLIPESDSYYKSFLNLQIKNCNIAREMIQNPTTFDKTKISINKEMDNYSPAISGNGKYLAFTAVQKKNDNSGEYLIQNIYVSESNGNSWSEPRDISTEIGSEGYFKSCFLNKDGTYMLLFRDDYGNGNIYYSEQKDGRWTKAKKLPKQISGKNNEKYASLSEDENVIYFSSDRAGGIGGSDIYKSIKDSEGRWGKPVNLGKDINTIFEEDAPVISEDGQTLYFASEAHTSMGGYDIFKAKKNADGTWNRPQNLGYPINTADDDLSYMPHRNGMEAYIAKYPDNGGYRRIYHTLNTEGDNNYTSITDSSYVSANSELTPEQKPKIEPPSKKGFNLGISGYIKTNSFLDTYQSVTSRNGDIYLYPKSQSLDADEYDLNNNPSLNMLSAQTRIRAKATGAKALGAKITGLVEVDFEGNSTALIRTPRLRHAYFTLNWEKTQLLFGHSWHPMFTVECFPQVIGFGAALPFNPLNRASQIKITQKFTNSFVGLISLNSHSNVKAQDDAIIPDIHAQLKYISQNFVVGVTFGGKFLRPRISFIDSLELEHNTNKIISAFDVAGFLKYKVGGLTFKTYGIYGQNLSSYVMLGGYGAKTNTKIGVLNQGTNDNDYDYVNINTISVWSEIIYSKDKWGYGLFAGYSKNLGVDGDNYYPIKSRGGNIDNIVRVTPRITYTAGKVSFGFEYMLATATYISKFESGKFIVKETADPVINHRLLIFAKYSF